MKINYLKYIGIFLIVILFTVSIYFLLYHPINKNIKLNSGVMGRVTIGNIIPVCRVGHPCIVPYQTTILVKDSNNNKTIKTLSTNKYGKYIVDLNPGLYWIDVQSSYKYSQNLSKRVTILSGKFDTLNFTVTTGIY